MAVKLLSAVIVWCCFFAQGANAKEPLQQVSQNELIDFVAQEKVQLIDVRTPREYAAGHIPSAINLPHQEIIHGRVSLDAFKGKTLVLYCHTGVRVGLVDQYLKRYPSFPREHILHLKGDFRAWQARKKTIVRPEQ